MTNAQRVKIFLIVALITFFGFLINSFGAGETRFKDSIFTGSVAIGTGTTAANSKAVLDLTSVTKGALLPRMTTTQRSAISSVPTGLLVFDTDLASYMVYNGSGWVKVGGDVTFAAVGSTPNSYGASASGSQITLQPADGTYPGIVSNTTQSFLGTKSFGQINSTKLIVDTTLQLDGTTLSTTTGNDDLTLSPSGTGQVKIPYLNTTGIVSNDASGKLGTLSNIGVNLGGLGGTSGTAGGIPFYTSSAGATSTAELIVNQVVLGGGAIAGSGYAPHTLAAGAQYVPLVMGATQPGYQALALNQAAATSGTLANSRGGTGLDSSASTGIAHISSGTWTASGIVNADLTGSAGITNANLDTMDAHSVKANVTAGIATPTNVQVSSGANASTFMLRNADVNVSLNNIGLNYATTATAGATTTLATTSAFYQYFTGTTTQTVKLPATTNFDQPGFGFKIVNQSTGALTIHAASGASAGADIAAGTTCLVLLINKIVGADGLWDFQCSASSSIVWPIANGGTANASLAVTNGGALYTDGTKVMNTGAGTAGQLLQANGAAAPTWVAAPTGGKNYILNPEAKIDTTGWAVYADASGASPVDGTGGSPSSTLARNTTTPIRGTTDFLWTHSVNDRRGEGFSYDFTVDLADEGKTLQGSFDYKVASGTFDSLDLSVWIVDLCDGSLIQPAPTAIQNSGIIEKFPFEFQTHSACATYRLAVHVSDTDAVAYTMRFTNFVIAPNPKSFGSVVTDWVAYTPTLAWTSGVGTTVAKYRRVGVSIEVQIYVPVTGAVTATGFTATLPSGLSFNTSNQATSSNEMVRGSATVVDASPATNYTGLTVYQSSTSVVGLRMSDASATYTTGSNGVTQAAPITFANGDSVYLLFSGPIVGWSSGSQVISTDAASGPVNLYSGSVVPTGTLVGSWSVTKFGTIAKDSLGAYDVSTGLYTVKVPGTYKVYGTLEITSTLTAAQAIGAKVLKGGSGGTAVAHGAWYAAGTETVSRSLPFAGQIECVAGDTLGVYGYSGGATNSYTNFVTSSYLNIERISGSQQIMAGDSVSARVYKAANQTVGPNGATLVKILFDTASFDSASGWASNKYTAQSPGKYNINSLLVFENSNVLASVYYAAIYKNGVAYSYGQGVTPAANTSFSLKVEDDLQLLAGDYIEIWLYGAGNNSSSTLSMDGTLGYSRVIINRTGNY